MMFATSQTIKTFKNMVSEVINTMLKENKVEIENR